MLIDQLKADQLTARKAGDRLAAAVLGVAMSEATRATKEPTDDQVLATLKKLRAGISETRDKLQGHAGAIQAITNAEIELTILNYYLPKLLSEAELSAVLNDLSSKLEISLRNMKPIKDSIEKDYRGRVDGKLLADLVKNYVAAET